MATVDTPRYALEVLSKVPVLVGVTCQGAQVLSLAALVATTDYIRAPRYAMEVLSEYPDTAAVTSQGAQVLADGTGLFPASADDIRVPRYGMEVVQKAPAITALTSQGVHVAIDAEPETTTDPIRAPRFAIEVLARRFIPLSGFTVPTGMLHYSHNWISGCKLESSYLTDVSSSAETLSEDRRQLQDRPRRVLDVSWLIHGEENIDTFLVELRRYNQERMAVPLYPDVTEITQTSSSGQKYLYCNTSYRRLFPSGMVAIVEYGVDHAVERVQYKQIDEKYGDKLKLTTNLDWTAEPGRVALFPLLRVHKMFELGYEAEAEQVFRVSASFEEVYGPTALPPLASDTPGGFYSYLGWPIFDVEPDWGTPLSVTLLREGSMQANGRGQEEDTRGERHRMQHGFTFQNERAETWRSMEFFDSRRGRLRAFWLIDREHVWTPVTLDYVSNYVAVLATGDFDAFLDELDYIGLLFSDGVSVVREAVSVQNIAGSYRITLDTALPVGYTISDIVRIGRARLTRNQSDTLKESWTTDNICSLSVETLELLEEKDVEFS